MWKFKTPNNSIERAYIRIDHNGRKDTSEASSLYFTNVKLEEGTTDTDWTPAPEDMLGKADFQIFTNTYEANDKTIQSRLKAIDSNEVGSVIYNANEALSTAQGNSQAITTLNTKVDGLKIGGNNLLKNTEFPNGFGGWGVNGSENVTLDSDTKIVKVIKGRGYAGLYQHISDEELVVGERYTFSVEVKGTGNVTLGFNGSHGNVSITSNDWERVSYTDTFKSSRAAVSYTHLTLPTNREV